MNNTETEILRKAYNAGADDEYNRLTGYFGKIEFSKVCNAIYHYSKCGSVIYDIGCGPGRYAEHLISKGYYVGGVDISDKSMKIFHEKTTAVNSNKVLFEKTGCASELEWIESETADTILLLGPMYHITNMLKRKSVINHCHRILKNSGHVISMFMSPFPVLNRDIAIKNNVLETHIMENYTLSTTNFNGFIVPQYRCWSQDAIKEFKSLFSQVETIHVDEPETDSTFINKVLNGNTNQIKLSELSHQYFVVFKKQNINI